MAGGSVIRANVGENWIVRRMLRDKNGNPLAVASCSSISAVLRQGGAIINTYTYPSANMRVNSSITTSGVQNCLEIEVIQTIGAKFKRGPVFLELTVVAADSDFVTDLNQKKIEVKQVAQIE